MKRIILTGGGTAGHVTPNIALVPLILNEGYKIDYIGGKAGIEKELITKEGLAYHGISAGKLRRYASAKNFTDLLRTCKGVAEALALVKKLKPDVIFSKGGFVTVPVAAAGWLSRVPVVLHESDISPGLANRICLRFASAVCVSFPETMSAIGKKARLTGTPIRGDIISGSRQKGLELCGFDGKKPLMLMMGGSLGSQKLNSTLRAALPQLLQNYSVAHICGKGNADNSDMPGYKQFEYVSDELRHIFAACDLIVSRAGANSISEFLMLGKPNLLIPLSRKCSRGDQIENAESFKKQGFSMVLPEDELTEASLSEAVNRLYADKDVYIKNMKSSARLNGASEVIKVINEFI